MNILSLFGGIECGYQAFEELDIIIDNYYTCEIDKLAQDITRYNFPTVKHLGNVMDFDFSKLKNIDIVIGGSPCTYWSISNLKKKENSLFCS